MSAVAVELPLVHTSPPVDFLTTSLAFQVRDEARRRCEEVWGRGLRLRYGKAGTDIELLKRGKVVARCLRPARPKPVKAFDPKGWALWQAAAFRALRRRAGCTWCLRVSVVVIKGICAECAPARADYSRTLFDGLGVVRVG